MLIRCLSLLIVSFFFVFVFLVHLHWKHFNVDNLLANGEKCHRKQDFEIHKRTQPATLTITNKREQNKKKTEILIKCYSMLHWRKAKSIFLYLADVHGILCERFVQYLRTWLLIERRTSPKEIQTIARTAIVVFPRTKVIAVAIAYDLHPISSSQEHRIDPSNDTIDSDSKQVLQVQQFPADDCITFCVFVDTARISSIYDHVFHPRFKWNRLQLTSTNISTFNLCVIINS